MKTRLVALIIGIVILSVFTSVYAVMYDCLHPPIWIKHPKTDFGYCFGLLANGHVIDYTRNLSYDKLCVTQFWTETREKPNQLYVKFAVLEPLKINGLDFSLDDITFYDEGSEFVVSIPGDWEERSSVVLGVTDALENINEIIRVKETAIACA